MPVRGKGWDVLRFCAVPDRGVRGANNLRHFYISHFLALINIINRPHIILFDEITSSLDSNSTKVFYEMLNTRLSSSTVLFVSHDDVVDSAFDRVLEIDELHAL